MTSLAPGATDALPRLRQVRLSHYWTIPTRPRSTRFPFMDLPPSIRRSVYIFLGLPVDEFISLNRASHPDIDGALLAGGDVNDLEPFFEDDYDGKAPWHGPIASLLLVTTAISNEVRTIFFSQNVFFINQGRWGSLKQLQDIGASGWRDLRSLTVFLQPCHCLTVSCTHPRCSAHDLNREDDLYDDMTDVVHGAYFNRKKNKHCRPLNEVNYNDRQILLQWEKICDRIATYGQPNRLVLLLMAMVDNVDTARRVVEPLFAFPRPLDVKISFGDPEKNCEALRELARETVLRVVDPPPDPKPFPFLELPVELQVMILEHTCLGQHNNLVKCQRGGLRWKIDRPSCENKYLGFSGLGNPDDVVHARQETAMIDDWLGPYHIFCRRASASFHKGCIDHYPTLSLCLVSRHFTELVKEVFYSHLEFEVCSWTRQPRWIHEDADADINSCAPRAFRDFLRRHDDAGSLQYIKHVTLLFPPMSADYLSPARKSWQLWLETIDYLAVAKVHDLKLTISFAVHQISRVGMADRWGVLSPAKLAKRAERYERIIEPLCKLKGLKALFIHVPAFGRDGDAVSQRRLMEANLERKVMGDEYDSSMLGKRAKTVWAEIHYPGQ
ncbi:uncharacterized protein DNG_08759 [Cephalotrichum gorgonifer]|uniref:F-box domain-containing protein n=1 Tax=Cephalotrichum gorgonifer TaxID=2041049 RepID=A0AAE8N742_9PEZI|nr:uncharacterized protein DNG_08759 [Cephalotrichum gorgonifer]